MKKTLLLALIAAPAIAAAGELPVINGSFEKGTSGFWINRADAVRIEPTDSTDGKQSVAVTPGGQKRVDIVQGVNYLPGEKYIVSFDARTPEESGAPKLTLEIMLQAAKSPIAMIKPTKEMSTPAALEGAWKNFKYEVGPFPASMQGKDVAKVMIYIRVSPGEQETAKVLIDNFKVSSEPASEDAGAKKK